MINNEQLRESVRDHYAQAARQSGSSCGCKPSSCCGPVNEAADVSLKMGYSPAEIDVLPEGANLGLGCGNPGAIASLHPGETVLDLGSGAGIDCFLAAREVGEKGRVIGVDMTPEMIYKARTNAARVGLKNVEFRLGEIEHLPVDSNFADVIISNCTINLSTDKASVWREAFRVLKPGGRLAIADVVATKPTPQKIRDDVALWSCCAAGASTIEELNALLSDSGFKEISIVPKQESRELVKEWTTKPEVSEYFLSANIGAIKP